MHIVYISYYMHMCNVCGWGVILSEILNFSIAKKKKKNVQIIDCESCDARYR